MIEHVLPEPGHVLGHAEEVVLLLNEVRLGQVLRTETVDELLFGIEAFAACAVMAAEFAEIDVPVVVDFLKELLDEARRISRE